MEAEAFSVTGVVSVDRLPGADEGTLYVGGSAAYVAAALARLGHPVQLWSRVGGDFDASLPDGLRRFGVRCVFESVPGPTARLDLNYDSAGNIIGFQYDPGVARSMVLQALGDGFWSSACVWLGTASPEYHFAVAREAAKRGKAVYLSTQGDYKANYRAFAATLPHLSGVFFNRREAAELCGGLEQAVRGFGRTAELVCVITCAARGALLVWRGRLYRVCAHPWPVVDVTGAGDAFAVSFVHRLQKSADPSASLVFASVAAAMSTRGFAQEGMPTEQEVEARLSRVGQEVRVESAVLRSEKAREWVREEACSGD